MDDFALALGIKKPRQMAGFMIVSKRGCVLTSLTWLLVLGHQLLVKQGKALCLSLPHLS